jgi:hypothetical protein
VLLRLAPRRNRPGAHELRSATPTLARPDQASAQDPPLSDHGAGVAHGPVLYTLILAHRAARPRHGQPPST